MGVRAMAAGAAPTFSACELNENRCGGGGAGGPTLLAPTFPMATVTAAAAWLPEPVKPVAGMPPPPAAAAAAAAFLDFFNSLARCSSNSAGDAAAALLAIGGIWRTGPTAISTY